MTGITKDNDHPSLIKPILNNWKLALSTLLLILVIIGIKAYTEKKYYQMTFFIGCNAPLNEELKITEGRLNVIREPFFSQSEIKTLCTGFQQTVQQQYPELKQITINTIRTMKENNSYEMVLQVYNTPHVTEIVNSLLNFLNQNSYFAENMKLDRKKYENILKEIDKQLHGSISADKTVYTEEQFKLIEKREEIKTKLEKLTGFELTVPPVIPGSYANMSPVKQIILALIWGSMLALVIAYFAGIIRPKHQ